MINSYFGVHNHTFYSNLRLIDCINKPKSLIEKAMELGLSGICITDHECLSAHMEVNKIMTEYQQTHPDFTIGLGNEIYLTEDRSKDQKYYHFILIAKDKIGHRMLKELSSIAWYNMYEDRRMERVPTLKAELTDIVNKFGKHLIATSACMGGELSTLAYAFAIETDKKEKENIYKKIIDFINYCKNNFGDDFYIECAPSMNEEQIIVNKQLKKIADYYEIKMVVGTDAHYLEEKDRLVHKSYLNSKEEEREVDDFYEFARLMSPDECRELLKLSFEDDFIDNIFSNTEEIRNKISYYSLEQHQTIPEVEVKNYAARTDADPKYPTLKSLYESDNSQERYWVNQCVEALEKKELNNDVRYWERLEEEARVKRVIGEKLQTCMFAYPNTLQHYIDLFWRCGSTVGAGRGSACSGLNHYLLGITQLDPIEWDLPFWRYLNDERVELGDIDIDLAPSKLPKIFEEIRKERGELGLIQVCAFGTEGTKSAILTACRGYRSDDYPNGIDVDEAQYLSSLIPQERGFLWPLNDVLYGNEDLDRRPVKEFVNEIEKFPGLKEICFGIEGIVCRRGSHASGVILFDENIYDTAAIMRTPSGALVTQWDLHQQESAGSVKYDFLLTSVQDIIIKTIELLQKDGAIESDLSLREVYNKYLHPSVLPQNDKKMWDALANGTVLNCFQFDSGVGAQAARKIKPQTALEMADANGLMRLMASEKGGEMPLDKYVRFKNNINLWYNEMTRAGLTEEEQHNLEPHFLKSYGVPPSQEQLMRMLMDENICGFSLAEANTARKIVGKKQMSKIPELHQKVLDRAKSPALGKYVWECGLGPQMGYSFSIIHALAYSFVGMQTLYLATNFNPIYWNTACLIVNSGSLEDYSEEEEVSIYAIEDDRSNGVTYVDAPDRKTKTKKTSSTDYGKVAKALGDIISAGIDVSLVDINKSGFGFEPDVSTNQILFGLKGMLNVGDDLVKDIISKRPYSSPEDFLIKVNPNKQAMISLIKGGAFDKMTDRVECMKWYIDSVSDKKKRITLQNLAMLLDLNLINNDTDELKEAYRVYEFNRYLKSNDKFKLEEYILDERGINFLTDIGYDDIISYSDGKTLLNKKDWDKIYKVYMGSYKDYIKDHEAELLEYVNNKSFTDEWNKYAKGNISSWEMEVLCFYYHDHELKDVNMGKYGLTNFNNVPDIPVVDRTFEKGGRTINIFKLYKICGTVIAKNKYKHIVTLLTTDGVVDIKFRKEYFALFDKTISGYDDKGIKHRIEKSWFDRGNMVIVQGVKTDNGFMAKKYNSSQGHQLYKITKVFKNGDLELQSERLKGEIEDE